MLRVKVIGIDWQGEEVEIGRYNQGVVLDGDRIKDVANGQTIVWQHHSSWETVMLDYGERVIFSHVFVQAVPEEER